MGPGDLNKLTHPENRTEVIKAEELLTEARQLITTIGVPRASVVRFVGRPDVRVCAPLCKTSAELEDKALTMAEIASLFMKDLSAISGQKVSWSLSQPIAESEPQGTGAAAPKVNTSTLDTVEQQSDLVHQARKEGFTEDTLTMCKDDKVAKVYKLIEYTGTKARMSLQEAGHSTEVVVVEVADVLKSWRVHKGSVTMLMPGWSAADSPANPLDASYLKLEVAKAKCLLAVTKVFRTFHADSLSKIELLVKPNSVRATTELAPGELVPAPMSTRFEKKKSETSWSMGRGST